MGLENVQGGKVLKHIVAKTYEIALYEFNNGKYAIGIEVLGEVLISQPITDLGIANYIFEQKQQALEGH